MRISTIAWANLRRRKGRAALLVAGIAIGIATAVALLSLSRSIGDEIGRQLDQYGANIVVVPKSDQLALDYGGVALAGVAFDVRPLTDEDARRIRDIPYANRLAVVAPKLLGAADTQGRQVVVAGVDFESEFALKRWWRVVGEKPAGPTDLLVGHDAAAALGLVEPAAEDTSRPVVPVSANAVEASPRGTMSAAEHAAHAAHGRPQHFRLVRDRLTLAGREYRVAGVLAPTGGRDDAFVFGSLAEVQSLLARPAQLSLVEVSALCKDCPVEDIVGQIAARLPGAKVSALQQAVRARAEAVERLTRFAGAVSAVVLLIGALMIFTTMTGAVAERTKEIGVMRAVGFRRAHIVKEMMLEVFAVSLLGGALGWAAGAAASGLLMPYFSQTGTGFDLDPRLAAYALLAALAVGALSSLYPTLRASRLDPSEAVRQV
ncbi:MAG TPA: FtsX-like permease family protein [Pyrinomonadaceae bacterium]|jgi:putative ABC transport system permease protein